MEQGKIIAVVGGPRSGKSFLVKKLAEHFGAVSLFEGEEGTFPPRILEDIEKNIRPLERILWFRNHFVGQYLKALEAKAQGKMVVLDVFWFSVTLHLDALLKGFELDVAKTLAEQDARTLSWPDLIIFLKNSEEGIRTFIAAGGRSFDTSEEYLKEQALPVHRLHEQYYSNPPGGMNLLTVERDSLDFDKKEDFDALVQKIKEKLVL
jgi:deoxyadenosine/deoxycytidine kinase